MEIVQARNQPARGACFFRVATVNTTDANVLVPSRINRLSEPMGSPKREAILFYSGRLRTLSVVIGSSDNASRGLVPETIRSVAIGNGEFMSMNYAMALHTKASKTER